MEGESGGRRGDGRIADESRVKQSAAIGGSLRRPHFFLSVDAIGPEGDGHGNDESSEVGLVPSLPRSYSAT